MARRTSASGSNIQLYPRIQGDHRQADLLDDTTLRAHTGRMSLDELKMLVRQAIANANLKSSRTILNIPEGAEQAEIEKIFRREGRELLKYFRKYCGDPAETARRMYTKSYREVGVELFRNRTLQRERMNSGRRYQFLAKAYAESLGLGDVDSRYALKLLYNAHGRQTVNRVILEVLMESRPSVALIDETEAPQAVIEAFGDACRACGLVDSNGRFSDPHRLVEFFCR